ncbi:hypothetical protein NDU88_005310 [Pleurodeles waltl]|uniref:Uncharacterized protein n=1 Tax=Pleurodeles waltl TaxID=8319 RepID=A0AAV7L2D8_PLEWA|nr:hypothetical protein NDU88_005310 [Pleurodeles waltl]
MVLGPRREDENERMKDGSYVVMETLAACASLPSHHWPPRALDPGSKLGSVWLVRDWAASATEPGVPPESFLGHPEDSARVLTWEDGVYSPSRVYELGFRPQGAPAHKPALLAVVSGKTSRALSCWPRMQGPCADRKTWPFLLQMRAGFSVIRRCH